MLKTYPFNSVTMCVACLCIISLLSIISFHFKAVSVMGILLQSFLLSTDAKSSLIYLLILSRSISDHHLRCGVGG